MRPGFSNKCAAKSEGRRKGGKEEMREGGRERGRTSKDKFQIKELESILTRHKM
jgi:hypothetical protein